MNQESRRRTWWGPRLLVGFAAGLAVGVVALLLVTGGKPLGGDSRPSGLSTSEPPSPHVLTQAPWRIGGEGIRATVKAVTTGDVIAIVVAVTAGEDVAVTLAGEDGQSLIGWQSEGGHVTAETDDRGGRFLWSGPDRTTVWLRIGTAGPGRVRVQLDHAGKTETRILGDPPAGTSS